MKSAFPDSCASVRPVYSDSAIMENRAELVHGIFNPVHVIIARVIVIIWLKNSWV